MKLKTDWKSCLDSLTVKRVKSDDNMIWSLIKTSKNRLDSENQLYFKNQKSQNFCK